jgi:two-component system sensor histidine kinase BarA
MKESKQSPEDTSIDWVIGIQLAGGKQDLANDLLLLLIRMLPSEMTSIMQAWETKNLPLLKKHVHSLRGAASYCGVPGLNHCLKNIDHLLKINELSQCSSALMVLDQEIQLLLKHSFTKGV